MATPERGTQYQQTPLVAEKGRLPAPTEALIVVMVIVQQSALMTARSSGNFPGIVAEQSSSKLRRQDVSINIADPASELGHRSRRRSGGRSSAYHRGSGRSRRERCSTCGQKRSSGFNHDCGVSKTSN